ncbi:alpha/beta hydrolase [Archangium sp.]|jgi:pimeloyl-ACP methyl ester carboxylesterase|uniref:alpha/beta fold hydrolase n=1 Tax=Archangium sp. TaxID=1872627 RepID=UPI002ED7D98C
MSRSIPLTGTAAADHVESGLFSGRTPYIRGGSGPKHAVVFFPVSALFQRIDTASDTSRYARQVAGLLPAGYRYTLIGYEEIPPQRYTIDTLAEDLAGVIQAEVGKPDLVIGISFGGFVAQRLAAKYPELVERLIILVCAHRFSESGWRRLEGQFKALETGDFYQLLKDNAVVFRRPWYNWLVRLKLWMDRNKLSSQLKDPQLILRAYRGLFSEDFSRNADFAKRIVAPTLVIGGTADQFFDTPVFEETARMIPNARLALWEGETHMLPIEKRGEVAIAVAAFLAEGQR